MFITAAEEFGAQIIGLSALMSTTMPSQKEVIDFLEAKGLRNKYKVIVGGGVRCDECFHHNTPFFLCSRCSQRVRVFAVADA